jgi:hypothetical protein
MGEAGVVRIGVKRRVRIHFAADPAFISPRRASRSEWNGMRPVSEEDEVIGLPRNLFHLMSNQHTAEVLLTN